MSDDTQTIEVHVSWEELMVSSVELDIPADVDLDEDEIQEAIRRYVADQVAGFGGEIGEHMFDTATCQEVHGIQVDDIEVSSKDQGIHSLDFLDKVET
jgi:hypothetical protein